MTNIVVLFLVVAAGSWMAYRGQGRFRSIALAVAAGPAVGLGCVFLVSFFILFAGIQLSFLTVAGGFILAVTALFVCLRPSATTPHQNATTTIHSRPVLRWLVSVAVALTVGGIGIAAYHWIRSAPHGTTDAVAFWTSRGLFLNRVENDIPLRFSLIKKGKPSYPLLLSGALSGQYTLSGNESLLTPQLVSIVVLVALLMLIWVVTYRFGGPLRASLAVLVFGSTPVLWRWAFSQCADVLVSYVFLLSAVGLFSLVKGKNSAFFSPVLTGFFLSLLFSAKVEGHAAALLLIVIAAGFAIAGGRFRDSVRHYAPSLFAGMIPGFAATILFKKVWCRDVDVPAFVRSDFLSTFTDVQRWRHTVSSSFEILTRTESVGLWGLVWLLVAVVLLVKIAGLFRGRLPGLDFRSFLFLACTGMILAYGSAWVLTPYDLDWQITKSIDRLLLQLLPSIAIAVILAIAPNRSAVQKDSDEEEIR